MIQLYNQRRGTSLSFNSSARRMHIAITQLSRDTPDFNYSTQPVTSHAAFQITVSYQCYRSGSTKILCEMLMN